MALPTNTGAFIHNGVNCTPNTIQTAQGVPYDNTSSGLSATNVQSAINEVYTCCIPLVYGTQTATTSNWNGELNVSTLYDGLTITYYLPYDSDGNVSLNLTLANGSTTGSKPVYLQIGKRLSTQYSAGAAILITYYSAGSISKSGTPTDADMWICNAESMQVQQLYLPNPPDAPYPVLFGVGLSVGNIFGPTVKDIYNLNYNPKTTTLTATKFSGDISGCTYDGTTGLKSKIDAVDTTLSTKQTASWTKLGDTTGTAEIDTPSSWNEMIVYGEFGGNSNYGFSTYVIYTQSSGFPRRFIEGCGVTNDFHQAIWHLENYKIGLDKWQYNATDYTSTSKLHIYYR